MRSRQAATQPTAGRPLRAAEPPPDPDVLLEALSSLAVARELGAVMAIVRRAARRLVAADGVTFVLREGDLVHYADEDAIGPLWVGRRFPASACISGWAIRHRESVVIEDVYADERIPHDAYRPTFVVSLAMVPIGRQEPVGAIGAYWRRRHRATPREVGALEALAGAAALALTNVDLAARLERSVRLRDEFIALAAHELNTPLAAVALRTEALARSQGDGAEAALAPLRAALARLTDTVGALGEFSRASRDGIALARREVDLAAVTAAAVAQASSRVAATGTAVRLEAPAPVVGVWDGARLGQAIGHLVDNAVKFGRGAPVDVSVSTDGGEARVAVRDRGPGVADADHDRIFGKFERAASADHVGGLGVGLWMARAIAEAHGGTVTVESAPGAGATFALVLPRRLPAA